jgi:hypothetical protein
MIFEVLTAVIITMWRRVVWYSGGNNLEEYSRNQKFTKASYVPILGQINTDHMLPTYMRVLQTHFNIILPSTRMLSNWFIHVFKQELSMCLFSLPRLIHYLPNVSLFLKKKHNKWRAQPTELMTTNFYPVLWYVLLSSKYSYWMTMNLKILMCHLFHLLNRSVPKLPLQNVKCIFISRW